MDRSESTLAKEGFNAIIDTVSTGYGPPPVVVGTIRPVERFQGRAFLGNATLFAERALCPEFKGYGAQD